MTRGHIAVLAAGFVAGLAVMRMVDTQLSGIDWEKTAKFVGEVVQAVAILGAGWWFLTQRSYKQKINLAHTKVEFVTLAESNILIRLQVSAENTGKVLVTPNLLFVSVHQVLPLKDVSSVTQTNSFEPVDNWDQIKSATVDCMVDGTTLEPGETQKFFLDFIVDLPLGCVHLRSELYALENPGVAKKLHAQHKGAGFNVDLLSNRDDVSVWEEASLHVVPRDLPKEVHVQ